MAISEHTKFEKKFKLVRQLIYTILNFPKSVSPCLYTCLRYNDKLGLSWANWDLVVLRLTFVAVY